MGKEKLMNHLSFYEKHYLDWTEEFENMITCWECPDCGWEPDCDDDVVSYGPKKYSYVLSLESSFPQYTWCVIYGCPKCLTKFKMEVESC